VRKTVAFQGARGAFSEQACQALLGEDLIYRPCDRFVDVFAALAAGRVRHAVVPIENTLAGSVYENYDHLLAYRLPIIGETSVRIVHNLIGRPEAKLSKIRRAISHPVALGQCLSFARKHSKIVTESHYDTGGSVKTVMEGDDPALAAIASAAAAEYYGAKVLKAGIEDDPENYTRFFLLARRAPKRPPAGDEALKTSIVFAVRNQAGALFKAMSAFALRDVNLLKIQSRPLKGRPFEYLFYLDFVGSPSETACRNALSHLAEMTELLVVLGTYRRASETTR